MKKVGSRKVVVITGAAGGIGTAVAEAFVQAQYSVALVDHLTKAHQLTLVMDTLLKKNKNVTWHTNDVTDVEAVRDHTEIIIEIYDRIDILVNCAGIMPLNLIKPFVKMTYDDLANAQKMMSVNYWGTLYWCQAVLPHMRKQGYGRIVNISSMASQGNAGNSIYGASKAAVECLTKSLAHEAPVNKHGDPFDITVNAVKPGIVETAMTKYLTNETRAMQQYLTRVPSGRKCKPQEVAEAMYFLATTNQYINGVILPVDGGYEAS